MLHTPLQLHRSNKHSSAPAALRPGHTLESRTCVVEACKRAIRVCCSSMTADNSASFDEAVCCSVFSVFFWIACMLLTCACRCMAFFDCSSSLASRAFSFCCTRSSSLLVDEAFNRLSLIPASLACRNDSENSFVDEGESSGASNCLSWRVRNDAILLCSTPRCFLALTKASTTSCERAKIYQTAHL